MWGNHCSDSILWYRKSSTMYSVHCTKKWVIVSGPPLFPVLVRAAEHALSFVLCFSFVHVGDTPTQFSLDFLAEGVLLCASLFRYV